MFSRLIKLIWFLSASLMSLFLLFLILLQTDRLHNEAIQIFSHLIQEKTNYSPTFNNTGGFLPFTLTSEEVIVKDQKNRVIQVENLRLSFAPLSLFNGFLGFSYSFEVSSSDLPVLTEPVHLTGFAEMDLGKIHSVSGTFQANSKEVDLQGKFDLENGALSFSDIECSLLNGEKKAVIKAKGSISDEGKCLGKVLLHIPLFHSDLLNSKVAALGEYRIEGDREGIKILGQTHTTSDYGSLILKTEAEVISDQLKAVVDITGKALENPIKGGTTILWNGGKDILISDFTLASSHVDLKADLFYQIEKKIVEGKVEGNIDRLASLFSETIPSLAGSLHFQALFSSENGQKLDLSVKGINLSFSDFFLSSLEFSSDYHHGLASPFNLTMSGLNSNMLIDGTWGIEQQGIDLSIHSLKGWLEKTPYELTKPFVCKFNPNELILTSLEIKIARGSLFADLYSNRNNTHALLHAEEIPLEIFRPFTRSSLPIDGLASLDVDIEKKNEELIGNLSLAIDQIRIEQAAWANLPELHAKMQGTIKNNHLELNGDLETQAGVKPATFQAKIPFLFSSPINLTVNPSLPLDVHLAAEGEIAHLLRLFMENTISISGRTKMGVDVTGTFSDLKVFGFLEVQNGGYEDLDTGAAFQNLHARFEGNQHELLLKELSADDGKKGTVSASGKIEIDPERYFPFTIALAINNASLVHLDYATATASGNVSLSGNFHKRTWEGELTLNKAQVTLPEEAPPQLKAIEVTYLNVPESDGEYTQFRQKKRTASTHLNVTLNIPGKAHLNKGRDLKSEWHGSITLTGTLAQPLLEGKLQLISGNYLFNGRSFVSHQGDIIFAGDPGKKTTLYIVAEQEIDRMKVETILKGPIYGPKLTFRSNPPLSEKEILSWILFNRGLNDITPFQGAQLSQTVFTISGGKDSSDVLSKIRRSIGIDRIDISSTDTQDSNEVSLSVGKYISKGVFVSVSRNINAEAHQVGIEAKMTRHIKVKGEVGDNAEGNMSLKWTHDY